MPENKYETTDRTVQHYGGASSMFVGKLPMGCVQCIKGEKIVLYTTGTCSVGCYYCPIPNDRQKLDSVFVNERAITPGINDMELISEESALCLASGAGITGGDPLEVPKRTLQYIRDIKQKFGVDYHLHLYTSGIFFLRDFTFVDQLFAAGLDELRLHPKNISALKIWELGAQIKEKYPDKIIGFEIPAIPDKKEDIIALILFADKHHLDFVNLNEYEFTESNFPKLDTKGFVATLANSAVKGSYEMIEEVFAELSEQTTITIHFCSSGSKDSIQLVQRFKHRASQIKRPFDQVSDEGELQYGRFFVNSAEQLAELLSLLHHEFDVPDDYVEVDEEIYSVDTAWYIVDEITQLLRKNLPSLKAEIISRHPIENGPITYLEPL